MELHLKRKTSDALRQCDSDIKYTLYSLDDKRSGLT